MDATTKVTGSSPSYFFNAVAKVATASPGMLVATATETSTRLTLQNCQKPEDVRPYVTEHLSMTLGFTGGVSDGNRIDSIFPSRGAHRDCSSIDYWTGPEREKFLPQATCSFDEATAAELGLALLESSDLEVEIVRQAVMGIEARSPRAQRGPGLKSGGGEFQQYLQPSASEPSAAKQSALGTGGTNLCGELSGEGDGAAGEGGPSRETATPAAKSAAAVTSPKFTPGGTARSLVTTNKERKEKVDLEALSRAAHQILQMHATEWKEASQALRTALGVTATPPPLHLLRPEVAIALARLVTDQVTATKVIVEGIIDARAGGQAWVETAITQTSRGVLPRAIAKLISRDQVELGSISTTEVVWVSSTMLY
jgi:hypothetical protein